MVIITTIKSKGCLDDSTYRDIYPTGSQPAKFYGLPKLHKKRAENSPPPFRRIVSSIGTYNYKLAKYLVSIRSPYIPDKYTTQYSFSFVEEFQKVRSYGKVLISFDVESLFTNIPLDETFNIAVETIFSGARGAP